MSIWLKPEDLVQLIRIGLDHPDLRFEVFYGASDNERGWWDNSAAFRYGYKPAGKSEAHVKEAMEGQAKLKADKVADWYQGGMFCSMDYDSDADLARY